ncbi:MULTISPECIES: hypothetical protein [unclassified Schlesneria]|uniref:hypothetical protein n=1 Tax=Schlesneria TaxID=656899 RepID=UPI002F235F87
MSEPQHRCGHDHHDHETCGHAAPSSKLNDYSKFGIQFQFPSTWSLDEQASDEEVTITVQSPGTSFWTAVIFPSRPDPEEVLNTVSAAFEQDYEGIDVVDVVGSFCGFPALGRDLDFECYDLINSACLRAFQTSDQTILVLYQGTDHELEQTRKVLEAISLSMRSTDDDDLEEELE